MCPAARHVNGASFLKVARTQRYPSGSVTTDVRSPHGWSSASVTPAPALRASAAARSTSLDICIQCCRPPARRGRIAAAHEHDHGVAVTHLCVSHLAVGVGKDDTSCKRERPLEKLHRGVDVGHGQIGVHDCMPGARPLVTSAPRDAVRLRRWSRASSGSALRGVVGAGSGLSHGRFREGMVWS